MKVFFVLNVNLWITLIEYLNKPTKEALEELIQKYPFTKIGKMYNVSNTAIKQWCKKYNLPFRKKDIYLYYNINKNK